MKQGADRLIVYCKKRSRIDFSIAALNPSHVFDPVFEKPERPARGGACCRAEEEAGSSSNTNGR